MPFKIVQTVEKGRRRLSIVPSVWEENGKLFWPSEKIKNRARLVRDESSFPSPHWDILDCVVKRNNIQTYIAAEHEIHIMENQTDTDDNETPATTTLNPSASMINTFEEMAQNLVHNDNNVGPSSVVNHMITDETLTLLPTFDCDQLVGNQKLLLNKINNQDKILQDLVENMQKITQKMAMLSVQINEGFSTIMEKIDPAVTLLKDASQEYNESFRLEQIDNKQQLESLEKTLMDKTEKSKLQKQLSFLFQPCEGSGLTYAYKLLDTLITRQFMCQCSWSGASRGNLSKVPLKDFKNFIKFFCDMIRSWDPTFTMGQTEKFFKATLKNALKRRAMKNLRSSSKRTRKTNPKSQTSIIKGTEPEPCTSNKTIEEKSDDEDLC